ncbi:hypothetical protein ACMX2H_15900 [Arthrobacter sulfonylureivorans]|uniref:hypothetical protein n=1 Tax=Arthrobacter sulfonylureivorans TaxID=2486855 RepID=UPI0039E3A9CE
MSLYWPDRPRMLISYAYKEALDYAVKNTSGVDLLVDSGAFTAFTLGEKISMEAYCDWLIENQSKITTAISLDVIGDWKGSARNTEKMLKRLPEGFPLMPVWHSTSPESELRRLCREHDYIGIGGVTSMASKVNMFMRHMVKAHKIARDYGTKLHGLGVTGHDAMLRLPWHTVDSSSWLAGARYGRMVLHDEDFSRVRYRIGDPMDASMARVIRAYGGDPAKVRKKGFAMASGGTGDHKAEYEWLYQSAARGFTMLEGHMRKRNKTEARVYLALATSVTMHAAIRAHALGNPFERKVTPCVPSVAQ